MKWMATEQALKPKPATAPDAILFNGLTTVIRAGWPEPASWEEDWGDHSFIPAQDEEQNGLHNFFCGPGA